VKVEKLAKNGQNSQPLLSPGWQKKLFKDHGLKVDARKLWNESKNPEYKAEKLGGKYFDTQFELNLAEIISHSRSRKMPVFKEDVIE